jgi:quercetin dioxygenase-like cupin family protein
VTSDDVLGDLPEYVLGTLPEARQREIDALLVTSPELARELALVRETLGAIGAGMPVVTPRPDARHSLISALDSSARFSPFVADLMRHLDMTKDGVRAVLAMIDDASRWEAGPFPGISLIHFTAGPNTVAPDTGLVSMTRGTQFPQHRHLGYEVNYVLQGAIRDSDGTLYLPGQAIEKTPGTSHAYSVLDDVDLVMVVVQAGFEMLDIP